MILNDWLKNKEPLFSTIMDGLTVEFLSADNMGTYDKMFKYWYGGLPVDENVKDLTMNEFSEMVKIMFMDKWTKQYKLMYNEIVDGVSSETVIKNKEDDTRTRETNRTNENNVSAFNDVDYSPDDEKKENSNELDEHIRNTERTDTKKSLWAVQEQLRMREKIFIKDVVMSDVKSVLVRKIY